MIVEVAKKAEDKQLDQALEICLHKKLYAGHDFRDVWTYLHDECGKEKVEATQENISPDVNNEYEQYQPVTRDMDEYISILEGGAS